MRKTCDANRSRRFWYGTVPGVIGVLLANLAPWWLTADNPATDGFQWWGFPFPAFGWGGLGPSGFFEWKAAVANLILALAAVWCLGWIAQVGPARCWTKLRTWGTPLDDD